MDTQNNFAENNVMGVGENLPPISLIDIVFPGDTNHHGTLFGGAAIDLMDKASFICATNICNKPLKTILCERTDFKKPVKIGEIIEFRAKPKSIKNNILNIEVEMTAETIFGDEKFLCTRGVFHLTPSDNSAIIAKPINNETNNDVLEMFEIVSSSQTNPYGKMRGGEAMKFMAKASFVSATRFCRHLAVLASSEEVKFFNDINHGDIIKATARVVKTGRSSIKIETCIYAGEFGSGEMQIAAIGGYVMVAVDHNGKPAPINQT